MELYFLRHGLAGQHGDPKYKDDSLRPLTAEGRQKIKAVARGMKALGLKLDCFLSSPYLRARQTAEIVAEAYKIKPEDIHLTDSLEPSSSLKALMKVIREQFSSRESLLLAGHEPHLSETVSALLRSQPLNIEFKKGGLASITIDAAMDRPEAVLNWLLTPGQLAALGLSKA